MYVYGSLSPTKSQVAPKRRNSTPNRRAAGAENPYNPSTTWTAVQAFFMVGPHSFSHRLVCGLPMVLGLCIAYAFWFGCGLMGWSVLTSTYFFASCVTTIGYGLPNDSSFFDMSLTEQWALIASDYASVVIAGAIMAVLIAAVHEAAENEFDALAEDHGDALDDTLARKVFRDGPWHAPGKSRMVEAGRRKAAYFRARLRKQVVLTGAIILLGTVSMWHLETWTWTEASCWVAETVTSLGFGQIQAATICGKAFTIVFALFTTVLFARVVGFVSAYPGLELSNNQLAYTVERYGFENGRLSPDAVAKVWPQDDEDALLEKSDFALRFLVSVGRLEPEDVMDACELFDRLAKVATQRPGQPNGLTSSSAVGAALELNRGGRKSEIV